MLNEEALSILEPEPHSSRSLSGRIADGDFEVYMASELDVLKRGEELSISACKGSAPSIL
jgi:hypothetical protein